LSRAATVGPGTRSVARDPVRYEKRMAHALHRVFTPVDPKRLSHERSEGLIASRDVADRRSVAV
jgi:hypothetical protein